MPPVQKPHAICDMTDLLTTKPRAPLAEQLRPESLNDVVGQSHLLGPGRPLRLALDSKKLHSFILWGPPGVGKTTIARLAAKAFDYEFIAESAVAAGGKELRGGGPPRGPSRYSTTAIVQPSCSSTKFIVSTRASRTPCCHTWRSAG